ncbi:phage tail length tape measure family protein [Rhizobium binae]|uniref:phage tail length tape measure family protein n=1 Tax=Rhizobium binae TaxID=1138190 RepID=UPI001C832D57|nr:phage tail length tape measure family protein [Rhizobium binae]MBX4964474.1 hypothetical protein [Rhizobium binae]
MADNTDDLIISISTDQATLRRSIQRIERDLAGLSGSVQKQFTAVGKSIDNSISSTMQNRINAMVGIGTKASKEWTGALADQGKELERLRAKYNPLFGAQQTYAAGLKEIKQAHAIGAISASEMTAALNREKIAFASQVSAIKARNAALEAMPANDNRVGGAFQTANIAAQFQDIGVTAAMGMNPLQIALQQGTQLSSVLATMGNGRQAIAGLGAAFASLLSPISLITIGLVAGSAALVQYFAAGEDGAKKTTPLIEKQNELIRDAAAAWGEALPSVTKVVDQLDRAKQISAGREAGDILGARALEGLGEKLEGINRQFAEAMRGLRGIQADPAFIRDFGKAFSDLKERLDNGTASIADINAAQQMLATAVDQYGVKSVLGFRDAFEKITESIQKSIAASKEAREEWIRALAGATSVQDITDGAGYTTGDGIARVFARKVSVAQTEPFAITTQGNAELGEKIRTFLAAQIDRLGVDDFLDLFLPVFLAGLQDTYADLPRVPGNDVVAAMAMWSETRGILHLGFQTGTEPDRPDTIPFELQTLSATTLRGPTFDLMKLATYRRPRFGEDQESFVKELGVSVLSWMREVASVPMMLQGKPGATPHHWVGGFVDMTTVDASGARVERIHTWRQDSVGQPIDPFRWPLNRSQRRAAKRVA